MSRNEALQQIVNHGGKISNSITRGTNVLIAGENDYQKMHGGKVSSKLSKALELQMNGGDIEIVSESVLFEVGILGR